jgi:hypothetical protein
VDKDEVVSGEQFCPARLTAVKDFGAHEDFEGFVIGEVRDGVLGAFAIMTPMTESENNSQHFTIVDIIVAFSGV